MGDSTVTVKKGRIGSGRWLLLIHQIPPKPDYLRVKVRRRLHRMGAVALKNSVYVLPSRSESAEDFRWLLKEIVADGGEATICEAEFVEGISRAELEAMFRAEREADYAAVVAAVQRLGELAVSGDAAGERTTAEAELVRLRQRLNQIQEIDFFGTPAGRMAERLVAAQEAKMQKEPAPSSAGGREAMRGLTWVTRRDVYIDRIASAWLIKRFIDPKARFKFTGARSYQPKQGEVRFDMFEAEYSHEGDRCTFETLLARAGLRDRALTAIGEIVHDIDCKDAKFGREEAPGIAMLIKGVTRAHADDATRLTRGAAAFDELYASVR